MPIFLKSKAVLPSFRTSIVAALIGMLAAFGCGGTAFALDASILKITDIDKETVRVDYVGDRVDIAHYSYITDRSMRIGNKIRVYANETMVDTLDGWRSVETVTGVKMLSEDPLYLDAIINPVSASSITGSPSDGVLRNASPNGCDATNWANQRSTWDGTNGVVNSTDGTDRSQASCDTQIFIYRPFFYFNVQGLLAEGETISAATLNLYEYDNAFCDTNERTRVWTANQNDPLDSASWSSMVMPVSDAYTFTSGQYNVYELTATSVLTDAVTKLMLRNYDHDEMNVLPSDANNCVYIRMSEYAGTTSDPYLDITVQAAPTPTPTPTPSGSVTTTAAFACPDDMNTVTAALCTIHRDLRDHITLEMWEYALKVILVLLGCGFYVMKKSQS